MRRVSKNIVENIAGIDSFRRINGHHLDIYIGKDVVARPTLLLISDCEPMQIYSSKIIGIRTGFRADKRWSLSFSLNDINFEDVFYHFCDDIIDSSFEIEDKKQGTIFICNRYIKWQELLKKNASGLLSFAEIKGLIGELVFLKYFLFEKYGKSDSLRSWIGPDKADQDFICPDCWYEVKTTVSGAESLKISSVEQLDMDTCGELVVVYLDKTSLNDPNKITLNEIVLEILESLMNGEQRRIFGDILLRQGYIPKEEYNEYIFKFSGISRYLVDETFPSLRRKDIPTAITNAHYTLSIASIADYLKED